MTTTPTNDEQAIRDAAARLLADRAPLETQLDRAGSWRPLHRELAGLDYFGLSLPEDVGGLGLSLQVSGLIAEAAGRELVPGPWLDTLIAVHMAEGDEALCSALTSGERVAAVVFPDDVRRTGDTVSGEVRGVRFGDQVNLWLLALPDEVVAIEPPGDVTVERSVDPLWRSVSARLDNASISATLVRNREKDLALAGGLVGAFSVGAAARVLDDAVAYVKDRQQFGKPIGSFQAIKHRAANAYISLLHARCLVFSSLSGNDVERMTVARIAADTCYRLAAETALQLHGGIGFTAEASVHLFLKSATQLRGWPLPVESSLDAVRVRLALDDPLGATA